MVFEAIIVDLGNVLFTLSCLDENNRQVLSSICRTSSWFNYEKGLMTEEEVYKAVAIETNGLLSPEEIKNVIHLSRSALKVQTVLFDLLHSLQTSGRHRLFAMSNISEPDYEFLQTNFGHVFQSLFEEVFPSHAFRDRKPNLSFFRRVIDRIGASPCRILFIDDELDNVIAAQSIGIRSVLADKKNFNMSLQFFSNLCKIDPCDCGMAYLRGKAGQHTSITSDGHELKENFSQLLLLEATDNPSLVDYTPHTRLFHFLQDCSTTPNLPFDIDTTSIGLTATKNIPLPVIHGVLDEILATCLNDDGIVQVYFDAHRLRIDPVVCVNALSLFYAYDRGHQLQRTEQWVFDVLVHRAYSQGTRYYATAECFLFFLARLLKRASQVRRRMLPTFVKRLEELLGHHDTDSLAISMRLLAADAIGINQKVTDRLKIDLEQLCKLQRADGSWDDGPLYRYGSRDVSIGNRGLTTALAINAIRAHRRDKSTSITNIPLYITAFVLCSICYALFFFRSNDQ